MFTHTGNFSTVTCTPTIKTTTQGHSNSKFDLKYNYSRRKVQNFGWAHYIMLDS